MTPQTTLAELRARVAQGGSPLYMGAGTDDLAFSAPQQAMLVLGPPRSGKTSSLVVPNVLAAPGAVVSTSTKPDVLAATYAERNKMGRTWLFDPFGTTPLPPGVRQLRWSPVPACVDWDMAIRTTRAMVTAARPSGYAGEQAHWTERAEALLAPLMHAAALSWAGIDKVASWVHRHELEGPLDVLEVNGASLGVDILTGIDATDEREQSGIWSTAAGVLAVYRSERVLQAAKDINFDPRTLRSTSDTVYICSPGHDQSLTAPLAVGLLEQIRAGTYEATTAAYRGGRSPGLPIALILDEVANIAPLPDLPAIVSEGGSQGLTTLACFQDLSQARARWGPAAEGFPTLFGTKLVLGGILDVSTLQMISQVGGEAEFPHNSVSRSPMFSLRGRQVTVTRSTRRQPVLPPDVIYRVRPGEALLISGPQQPRLISLPPWWSTPPFNEQRMRELAQPTRNRGLGREL